MKANQDEVLLEIEAVADQNRWPIIGTEKGSVLGDVIREHEPKRILEIGMLVGYSAILMTKFLSEDAWIICLEINPEIAKIAKENFEKAGVSAMIEVRIGDGRELIPALSGTFDMVFLDAAKEQYIEYLKLVEPMLSPKAVVVADNAKIFAAAMADYFEYVRANYQSEIRDFGFDAVEVSRRR